ncbi:MAG: response regulator [Chloroflexaceae bacterium]|nr:response regulator [Chloroflexaceae bacterium]
MSRAATVLVIDDEQPIRRLLQTSLEARGYRVQTAATGEAGLVALADQRPDLILLDLGLPDIDGVEVLRRLREWSQVPVIILSARSDEQQKIDALDEGADDYLTKPFSTGELLARLRVAERHAARGKTDETVIRTGVLTIDLVRRTVSRSGQSIHLTPTEYALLRELTQNLGRVLTHSALLRAVWGPGSQQDTQLLRGFMAQVRQKIEPTPNRPAYIVTEPGVGYRMLELPVIPVPASAPPANESAC